MKNKKQVPKYALGALIAGQALSAGLGIFGAIGAKKKEERANKQAQAAQIGMQKEQDLQELEEYDTEGRQGIQYYNATGGKIDPNKGKKKKTRY